MKENLTPLFASLVAFCLSLLLASASQIALLTNVVLIVFFIQWILYIPAYVYQTETFYDLGGSLTYLTAATYVFSNNYLSHGLNWGNLILSSLMVLWTLRLGCFLFYRVLKKGEDKRFKELKTSPVKFFMTWTLQGMWVSLCSLCALTAIASKTGVVVNGLFYLGVVIFILGFVLEITADVQKTRFRADPKNEHRFINSGLWSYSRHPNYLGEIILWTGIAISSFSSLQGTQYFTLISPLFTYLLLVHVSGINILEKNGQKKWGHLKEYEEYLKKTPKLLF